MTTSALIAAILFAVLFVAGWTMVIRESHNR